MTVRFFILISPVFFVCLFLLYIYQYRTTPVVSPTSIVVHSPQVSDVDPHLISWAITAPSDLIASQTTIYYGSVSSPSALTPNDSPAAVGYPNRVSEYLDGSFKLPDTFSATLKLSNSGPIYARAYAQIRSLHYWSPEITLLP